LLLQLKNTWYDFCAAQRIMLAFYFGKTSRLRRNLMDERLLDNSAQIKRRTVCAHFGILINRIGQNYDVIFFSKITWLEIRVN
jgi:hypothetical protein